MDFAPRRYATGNHNVLMDTTMVDEARFCGRSLYTTTLERG